MNTPAEIEYLSNADCMEAYSVSFLSGRRNLVVVTNVSSDSQNATIFGSLDSSDWLGNMVTHSWDSQFWIRIGNDNWIIDIGQTSICNTNLAEAEASGWTLPPDYNSQSTTYLIDHCLSELTPEKSQPQFIVAIMIIVIVCNLAKVSCIGFAIFALDTPPWMSLVMLWLRLSKPRTRRLPGCV